MRPLLVLASLVVASTGVFTADPPPRAQATGHEFGSVEKWVAEFERPDREEWQKPKTLVRVLTLEDGQTVADIGAGTGYITRLLSIEVGDKGKVYAVDVEPAMLEYIRSRKDMLPNVVTIEAAPDDPKLPADAIDLVTIVNTWHHLTNRVEYLAKLGPSLSREGRVAVIDWRMGDLPIGPPPERRVSRDQVVSEFEKAGWRLDTESVALPYQYFLVFYPPARSSSS